MKAPSTIEAEMALCGAALFDNALTERVTLEASQFFDPVLGDMWAEICARVRAGRGVDGLSMREWFKQRAPELSLTRLMDVMQTRLLPPHEQEYALMVREGCTRRAMIASLVSAQAKLTDGLDLFETIGEIEATLRLLNDAGAPTALSIDAASSVFIDNIDKAGLPIGIAALDRRLCGLYAGELIILGGRPSMGKTALAASIARNVATAGGAVHFASLDMSREQLACRAISAASWGRQYGSERVEYHQLRGGAPNISRQLLRELASELPSRLVIDDRAAQTVSQIEQGARATRRRKKRLDLIVVDYLQLVRGDRAAGRNNEVAEVSADLKAVAKRLNVPLLALSQLSRQTEHRDNKRPSLADLRDSGAIEQDADVVLGVYREAYYLERAKPDDNAQAGEYAAWKKRLDACARDLEVLTLKQRQGPIGSDVLDAHLAYDVVRDARGEAA